MWVIRVKVPDSINHSSLLSQQINYDHKKVCSRGPKGELISYSHFQLTICDGKTSIPGKGALPLFTAAINFIIMQANESVSVTQFHPLQAKLERSRVKVAMTFSITVLSIRALSAYAELRNIADYGKCLYVFLLSLVGSSG
jgi:hypothetical protein